MLPALIAQMGVPFLVNVLSDALKSIDNPVAKTASDALQKVDEEIQIGQISLEKLHEANRHTETLTKIRLEQQGIQLTEINKSLRSEIASNDRYVRHMRPTFGYLMALTWAAQMFGVAYVIIFETQSSGEVLNAMASLSTMWAVGLSVLGVYVYKRSEEKTRKP